MLQSTDLSDKAGEKMLQSVFEGEKNPAVEGGNHGIT